jgi:hypothetical protein
LSVLVRAASAQRPGGQKMPSQRLSPSVGVPASVKLGDLIEVTGVDFFDFEHGQTGVAPYAIELHPVLGIRRVE